MTPPPRARVWPLAKTGPRGPARAVEPVPLPVADPQAEADLPEAGPSVFDRLARRRPVERPTTMFATQAGGTLILSGLPVLEQRHLYGQVALQVSALGQAPEARNGVTLQGIIARTLWHGDCVVVHCMAGRHRAALLVCVTLALLRGTSLAATETWMLTRRQIELNEVRSRDPQLWDWANRAVRGTRMPTLCRHAQGQARASNRLRNAYSTSDRHEAVAWQRPICDECFRRASASFWPVV